MAEKLTPQQEMAVTNRGGKLLVSAAAGSGKTKVLVDRLMSYLMDPRDPANLDDFLMITYTKAAAAELRGKIAAKLSERIAQNPENRHLQRQMQRLYLAKISTVHSFCGDVLREYAYRLDLSADFRMADENECRELRQMALERVLDGAYENVAQDSDFRDFVDTQGLGRTDSLVPDIIQKVYDSAMCHLDPEKWLDECLENAAVADITDAGQTIWGEFLIRDLFEYLDLQIEAMEWCANSLGDYKELEKQHLHFAGLTEQLRHLRASGSWDEIVSRKNIDYGSLRFPTKKNPDPELSERVKAVRAACKEGLTSKLKAFADPTEQVLSDLRETGLAVRGLVKLVRGFGQEFSRIKAMRHVLDFSDLEHRMLDLLLGKDRSGRTSAAREIEKRFREIMVDEYQDSNEVQDAIFDNLTRERQNCFMVGDVKQSIYRFRLADPGIFLKKYQEFLPAQKAKPGEGRKILLSSNFRSSGGVLAGVNDVFYQCMSPAVGGLRYTEAEALREGIPHVPLNEPEVELNAIVAGSDAYGLEAAFVADRIAQLLDGKHMVRQGDQLRAIQPEDIAILLRSPKSAGHHFIRALEKRGIRCATGGGVNLLETAEVGTLRSLLAVICNPRQDIPLLAVLASPIFGFSADDLAAFRGADKKSCIYDALRKDASPKAGAFLETLEILRREAKVHTLAQLVERIFTLTRMDSIYAAMEGGQVRLANLHTFYSIAADYESSGRRDLGQFLDYLSSMEDKGLIAEGELSSSGAVTLLSIHKSKGLEYPVVILSNLSRDFNWESLRAQVLCDQTLGLGLSAVDRKNRMRYPTIAKKAIAVKAKAEGLSEEMRVLYVAMTRARDRLIMTYTAKSMEKILKDIAMRSGIGSAQLLTGDVSCCGDWVMQTAMQRTEAGELFALGGKPAETRPGQPVWKIRLIDQFQEDGEAVEGEEAPAPAIPEGTVQRLGQALQFRYAHDAATRTQSKQTATDRKGRYKDMEAAENTAPKPVPERSWRKPAFVESTIQGKTYGSAIHAVLQYIRYENCDSLAGVEAEVERLAREGFITAQQKQLVRCDMLARFFTGEMGTRLRGSKNILREFKFSILDDGCNYGPGLEGERVLLQGVVDCAIVDDDGIVILDFKTDFVTEETVDAVAERYRPRVDTYASAMSRIYQRPVKGRYLYFFRLDRLVQV